MPIISARGSMPGSSTNGPLGSDCAGSIILYSSGNAGTPAAAYAARGGLAAAGARAGPRASNFVGDGSVAVDADGI
jgi:hypothetical protein